MSVIERRMNGLEGWIMEGTSLSNGVGTLTLTFKTGTNSDLAQVDVQNRLSRAEPRCPVKCGRRGFR